MKGKIALNTLYTLGIFLCGITVIWGVQHSRYEFVVGAVLVGAMFVWLKISIIKEVKTIINNSNKKK